jgi:hypothetical protein
MSLRELIDLPEYRDNSGGFDSIALAPRNYPTIGSAVTNSLDKMSTLGEGHMPDLLITESMGGNAGSWNGYMCSGVSFCYDTNGEMVYFENIQHIPLELQHLPMGIFRVANTPNGAIIIDIKVENDVSPLAKQNIETAVNLYNASKSNRSLRESF